MKHIKLFEQFLNEAKLMGYGTGLIESTTKSLATYFTPIHEHTVHSFLKKGTKVTIANDVKYYEGEFEEIVLTNGYKLTADEDTGGEGAYASIDGIELKKGDVISFNRNVGGDTEYFDKDTIIVNGKKYIMHITAAGGNEGTILDYDK